MSNSQTKAVMRYYQKNKDRIHKFNVTIYDSKDPELWLWLTSRNEGKGEVVRRLIREEIARSGWKQRSK